VFDTLIESKRKTDKKRLFGVGFVSLMIHTALIAAAVIATVTAGQSDTKVRTDTALVFLDQTQKPPEQQPVQLDVPLKGFQTVVAPTEIPTNIPPINLQEKFDPKDYSGSGVEGGVANGMVPTGDVYAVDLVEEKPSVLSGQLVYPPLLEQAGIGGQVTIQAIVDTTGRVEANSVRTIQSSNPAFEQAARTYVLKALWRPARVHGRAVRVLVSIPLVFKPNTRPR
jgi:TonB family protein